MSLSLYDAVVGTYQQILGSTANVLAKGRQHYEAEGKSVDDIMKLQMIDDMLPFTFQVTSVVHHSINALKSAESGDAGIPKVSAQSYADLESQVADAISGVNGYSADQVNGLVGKPVVFSMGPNKIPFTAEDYLMSFSLPNFYFHATTTYDLLRREGVKLGKMDFLGALRVNRG